MKAIKWLSIILVVLSLTSCEESITLDLPVGEEQLVVEGHIEQGAPPIVILTRSVPVFANVSLETLESAFVHNAQVTVAANGQTYTLQEVPSAAFSEELKEQIALQFGVQPGFLNSSSFPFYVYTTDQLSGVTGEVIPCASATRARC